MPYIPKSDCECYMEALELLNEALAPIDGRISALEENNCCEVLSDRLDGIDTELDDHEERILELENIDVPVFTLQTTDPGEGVALEANHFICVYEP